MNIKQEITLLSFNPNKESGNTFLDGNFQPPSMPDKQHAVSQTTPKKKKTTILRVESRALLFCVKL